MITFNLLTMTLDMHLYITLQYEISLKSFTLIGFSILGTKVILVALTHLGRVNVSKKSLTITIKSPSIISQCLLKNNEVYPSKPKALSSRIENKAILISSSIIEDSKTEIMLRGIRPEKNLKTSSIQEAK